MLIIVFSCTVDSSPTEAWCIFYRRPNLVLIVSQCFTRQAMIISAFLYFKTSDMDGHSLFPSRLPSNSTCVAIVCNCYLLSELNSREKQIQAFVVQIVA
jgi:hypothetical protein